MSLFKNIQSNSEHPKAAKGWSGPHKGYTQSAPIDPNSGKMFIEAFDTIEEAIAKADELGADGITKHGTSFRVRIGGKLANNREWGYGRYGPFSRLTWIRK
tara:strand:- start:271 stop:573 length:303 start_codon:yes stop_codon:yes gene_type:complete